MPKKIISCPVCKGRDLNYLPWLGQIYECRKCGYKGPIIIEKSKRKKIIKL